MPRGAEAEDEAARYLQRQGLRLVARNWRCRYGELDLVMADGAGLVFVEVRARSRGDFGGAAESITAMKRQRLVRAAQHYLQKHPTPGPCRFDAVVLDGARLTWLRNAFEAG